MSCAISLNKLTEEQQNRISEDLEIKIEQNKYDMGPPKYVYPYEIDQDNIIHLPFAYGYKILQKNRPARTTFPQTNLKFNGVLRENQKEIKKEAVEVLNKKGRIIISCFTGFGKCLKKNTPVLMFDGTTKHVQDIKVGDILMGDDSTPRNVLSTCIGTEQMYDVIPNKGMTFGCNESHILSLKISEQKYITHIKSQKRYSVRWLDERLKINTRYFSSLVEAETFRNDLCVDDKIDMELNEYLKLSDSVKDLLKLYKVPVDFSKKDVNIDPYFLGLWLGDGNSLSPSVTTDENRDYLKLKGLNLTCYENNRLLRYMQNYDLIGNKHIPHNYKCNSRNIRLQVLAGLVDSIGYYQKNVYEIVQKNERLAKDIVYLARSLGFASFVKQVDKNYLVTMYGKDLNEIPVLLESKKATQSSQDKDFLVTGFKVSPIDDTTYYGFTIDGNHRFLLGDFTVTHNTATAINITSAIGFKTLVVVHRVNLIKQWAESIEKFCPEAKIQRLTTKSTKKDADFYIVNAINVPKLGSDFFSDIGSLVVDEAHLIMAEKLSKCMQHIHPRYVIALTATPYRPDGLNILLELYFGSYKIIRELYRKHTVYKINTGFVPRIELTKNGRVNWNVILDEQANNIERNNIIFDIIEDFSDRVFMVLTKRISQAEYLLDKLEQKGEKVTSMIGSQQEFDKDARILIGTIGKIGVGFDHSKLNALILAGDVEEYFIQYLGRVFRTQEVEPIIFDIIDKNSILEKHFATRRQVYQKAGGVIKKYNPVKKS